MIILLSDMFMALADLASFFVIASYPTLIVLVETLGAHPFITR
jgi:hypothetical protein